MEPGHEDREYMSRHLMSRHLMRPQWSPVMKTGNTGHADRRAHEVHRASMEPGHEDREYPVLGQCPGQGPVGLNGARS